MLTDDPATHLEEATAARERAAAFQHLLAWKGQPLLWTPSRSGLYDFLRIPAPLLSLDTRRAIQAARDATGTPQEADLQEIATDLFNRETGGSTGHLRNAQIILWLAAHQPKDWTPIAHDRPKLHAAIDTWIDGNVSYDEMHQVAEITNELLAQADKTRAIVRPKHQNPDDQGN